MLRRSIKLRTKKQYISLHIKLGAYPNKKNYLSIALYTLAPEELIVYLVEQGCHIRATKIENVGTAYCIHPHYRDLKSHSLFSIFSLCSDYEKRKILSECLLKHNFQFNEGTYILNELDPLFGANLKTLNITIGNLFDKGMNVNLTDNNGRSLLLLCVQHAILNTCDALLMILRTVLEHKPDIEQKDKDGRTPFQLACLSPSPAVIWLLLEFDALPISAKTESGIPLLHWAYEHDKDFCHGLIRRLLEKSLIKILNRMMEKLF